MRSITIFLAAVCLLAGGAHATSYTQNANLNNFTTGLTFATFTQDSAGDVGLPYTPTAATVALGYRVVGNGATVYIVAQFASPVSNIVVFSNIDHFGAPYDGYQYSILGSNDGVSYTPLFDALTVNGLAEPFTVGSFTGTAPYLVNNVLTPGAGPGGTVGYEAFFSFSQAYKYYEFGASTVAINDLNDDHELSAIGTPTVPEPASCALLGTGLAVLAGVLRKKLYF